MRGFGNVLQILTEKIGDLKLLWASSFSSSDFLRFYEQELRNCDKCNSG